MKAAGEYQRRVRTSAMIGSGKPKEAVVYLDGQLKWSKASSAAWSDLEAVFDANLPKGLHSLQVQRSTATGSLTLKLVNVTKPRFTNALFWDTDRDALSDGDELLGHTGWMLSPTKIDTDADGASDGDEVRTRHTDPLLPDTDHDGFNDLVDLDPLHDLVVQLRINQFAVVDPGCAPSCLYWARAHVNSNWTNSANTSTTVNPVTINHLLSVNVPDNAAATVKIQVFANDVQNGREIDVASGAPTTYTTTVVLTEPDRYGLTTSGYPTASYAWASFDIRVFRVGKANTLLMTPNDWSTLSNGTADGEPTGLHRYVGENRFVFVLLNVTDGHGNLASYDMETKDWDGVYKDFSGTGLAGYHSGVTPEIGRFGLGARLSGSGSYVSTPDDYDKLDGIDDALTVAFWIRPDEDYVSQAGWKWSTGRQGLWRLGFADGKVRFEVTQNVVPYTVHFAEATHPLYAGRWVHLAATMTSGPSWTNLSVYVGGAIVAWKNESAYQARDGTPSLRIGWDEATGGRFKGLVDEFRLYKTALAADSVRGLPWFLHGSNNVLIPRGVFFDSKLFASLNASSYDPNSPLAGANVNGNDNKGTASLNARVIQMVITKNATLAQASQILTLAATNTTNVVTAFPLLVANEFYTLGLAKEVRDLAASVVVENSGNASAPPPSPTLWQLFWNTVAGIAGAAWNAVVAVAQFFINVGKWLVDAFIGIFIGLVTGNWTYFQQNVLEPLRKALEALVKFIFDLVLALFQPVVDELSELIGNFLGRLDSIMRFAFPAYLEGQAGPPQGGTRSRTGQPSPNQAGTGGVDVGRAAVSLISIFAPLMALITLIFYLMVTIELATKPLPFVAVIMVAIASLIIAAVSIALLANQGQSFVEEQGGAPDQAVQRSMGWENLNIESTFRAILLAVLGAIVSELLHAGIGAIFVPLAQLLVGFFIISAGERAYRGPALFLSDLIGATLLYNGALGRLDVAGPTPLSLLHTQTRWLAPITWAWDLVTRIVIVGIGALTLTRHFLEGLWTGSGLVETR